MSRSRSRSPSRSVRHRHRRSTPVGPVRHEANGNDPTPHPKATHVDHATALAREKAALDGLNAQHDEFGGPWGVAAIMLVSHVITFYLIICLELNQGGVVGPDDGESWLAFVGRLSSYALHHCWPTRRALLLYLSFVAGQALLGAFAPGFLVKGLPLPSENGQQLDYKCNGQFTWYFTLVVYGTLHFTGILPLYWFVEELPGMLMVAVIFGNVISIAVYMEAHLGGRPYRNTGSIVYDVFMGASLNPRTLGGRLDLKFWSETRISWILLFLLSASMAAYQQKELGYVTPAAWFMVLAHALYANACCVKEEAIPTTWDISSEAWGWMLAWWNFAGVPFVYAFQSLFLFEQTKAGHPVTHHPVYSVALFAALLFAYYVWDTANAQKNRYRMMIRGTHVNRNAFPQLPWSVLKDPKVLPTAAGSPLLIDGWWKFVRKPHYVADITMAFLWGASTGFTHFLPYFYFFFFVSFLSHRAKRDSERCAVKYGKDWDTYLRHVPYVFIPGIV